MTVEELESCLRRLVSMLALPSACHGRSLDQVLVITLDTLQSTLQADLAYARVTALAGHAGVLRIGGNATSDDVTGRMRAEVDALGARIAHGDLARIRDPRPAERGAAPMLSVLPLPLGYHGDAGLLVVASARADFPTMIEGVLARAGASLAAASLEEARARSELERAHAAAKEANRAKDEFLAVLGHELRNPLAPIAMALHLLRQPDRPPTGRELTIIERQLGHLGRLVDDLLEVSRIGRGKLELRKVAVDAREVVAKAIEIANPLIEQRRQRLELRIEPVALVVDGDPVRLAQVLSNLLTNAAKYGQPGGTVELAVHTDGDHLVVRVRDDGVGIDPAVLPRIFDPFVQAPHANDHAPGGLGLGLHIVKNLVELHGGTVAAHSDGRGRGTEVVVRLPRTIAATPTSEAAPPAPETVANGRRRILVVDDNRDAGELLAESLGLLGYDIAVAYDGPGALEAAAARAPELAILDIGLPGLDGYQVAARLRADHRLAAMRLIAVTGYGQRHDQARAVAAGFDAHLVKPVDLANLRAIIERLLSTDPRPAAAANGNR